LRNWLVDLFGSWEPRVKAHAVSATAAITGFDSVNLKSISLASYWNSALNIAGAGTAPDGTRRRVIA
jgi:hypothetical protein